MKKILIPLAVTALCAAGIASADEEGKFERQIEARQGIMVYRAIQLGVLGAMAKGEKEYDADAAQKAADNLLASSSLDLSMLWPEGSDSESVDDSYAKPALWAADSTVGEESRKMVEAAAAMQSAASQGLDALKEAMGPVGNACSGCHKPYRAPEE